MDYQGLNYFGFSSKSVRVLDVPVFGWHIFNREMSNGVHESGAGLINVNGRHLLYLGRTRDEHGVRWRLCVAFVWLIGGRP